MQFNLGVVIKELNMALRPNVLFNKDSRILIIDLPGYTDTRHAEENLLITR